MDWKLLIGIIPSIITAIVVFYLQRNQQRHDKWTEERATLRQQESYHIMQMTKATMTLCQVNAVAIRDGTINGKMEAAMRACEDTDKDYSDFIRQQGAAYIHLNR